MARIKINRYKYSCLIGRERRPSSLQECLDNKATRRESYKNWIVALLVVMTCLHYVFKYWFSDEYEITSTEAATEYIPDEFITMSKYIQQQQHRSEPEPTEPTTEFAKLNFYRVDEAFRPKTTTDRRKYKKCLPKMRYGKYAVNVTKLKLFDLADEFPMLEGGGYYRPPNCTARQTIAIVVAFRSRETSLATFLYNIHPFLMMQQLEYQIFVIEQSGQSVFNKGRLYNAGYKEVSKLKKFECIVFHDVDLLPMNLEIQYNCPTLPRHMSSVVNDTEFRKSGLEYKFESLFGGVVSMTMEMIYRVNGYSNVYFGWGGEDNDMLWRLRAVGYPIVSYNKTIGVYLVLPHNRAPVNEFRHHLLATALERYKTDGLSNLEYQVVSKSLFRLYTHIVVEINPRKENISLWYVGGGTE